MTVRLKCQEIILNKQLKYNDVGVLNTLRERDKYFSNHSISGYYQFGYRFYYWDYFRGNKSSTDKSLGLMGEKEQANHGYTLHDLYVSARYSSLKTELLFNDICKITIYQWNALTLKGIIHLNSKYAKSLMTTYQDNAQIKDNYSKYYGIRDGDSVQLKHLLAMMIYCNYDKLQRKFSETCRYLCKDESLQDLKIRHRNFVNLAKHLRELHFYGQDKPVMNTSFSKLTTLFHGVQEKLNFGQVNTRIGVPLSCTASYAVAVNFCSNSGMILELEHDETSKLTETVPCIDCSWLSDFINEQERFLIGATIYMKLSNIITVTGDEYALYLKGLTALKNLIVGWIFVVGFSASMLPDKDNALEQQFIFRFLSHELNRYYKNDIKYPPFKSIPPYIDMLLHNVCADIKYLNDVLPNGHPVFDYFFRYNDGWIKLDRIVTVFPSLERISLLKKVKLETALFYSVLDFLENNKNTKLKQIILKRLDETDMTKEEAMKTFGSQFDQRNWFLFTTKYEKYNIIGDNQQMQNMKNLIKSKGLKLGYGFEGPGKFMIIGSKDYPLPPHVNGQVISTQW
eukprot:31461_1